LCVGWEIDGGQEEAKAFEDVAELKENVRACCEEGIRDLLTGCWGGWNRKTRFDEVNQWGAENKHDY